MSNKSDLRIRKSTRYKQEHYIMIEGSLTKTHLTSLRV